jgi:hypothetical protein
LTQQLTDRLLFTLPMEDGVGYELIVRSGGNEQKFAVPADGANFTILNEDTGRVKTRRADGETQLIEYAILYNLTSASKFLTLYPFPTANLGFMDDAELVGGGDEPVCGGGQSDGDDDPPPGF